MTNLNDDEGNSEVPTTSNQKVISNSDERYKVNAKTESATTEVKPSTATTITR